MQCHRVIEAPIGQPACPFDTEYIESTLRFCGNPLCNQLLQFDL